MTKMKLKFIFLSLTILIVILSFTFMSLFSPDVWGLIIFIFAFLFVLEIGKESHGSRWNAIKFLFNKTITLRQFR